MYRTCSRYSTLLRPLHSSLLPLSSYRPVPVYTGARSVTTREQFKNSIWPADKPLIKAKVCTVGVLLLGAKVSTTLVPYSFREIVNALSVPLDVDHLPEIVTYGGLTVGAMTLVYGGLRALSPILNELKNTAFSTVAQNNVRSVSQTTYNHLLNLDLSFHQTRKTGELSRVIDRGTRGADAILRALVVNIIPTVWEMALVFGLLWYSAGLEYSLICAGTTVLYIGFTFAITQWRTKFRKEMNKADNQIGAKAVDSLLNYETIKYFNNEEHEARYYDKLLARYEQGALKTQSSLSLLNSGQQVIITGGITLSMYLAVGQILAGQLTVGDLVMINMLLFQLAQPLNFLGTIYRDIQQSYTDMKSLSTLLAKNSGIQDSPAALPAVIGRGDGDIEFRNVTFSYDTLNPLSNPVLKDISFKVPVGQTVAIVGGSGSGKSTIVRLLYRFYDPCDGEVLVGGRPLTDMTLQSYRKAIGVVPQDCVLFNEDIHYNIKYGNTEADDSEIVQAAQLADLHDAIERLPKGYQTLVGERGQMLSGGEKQRVALARAILKDAPILIYDEATSSLDTVTEQHILTSLDTLSKGRTSIFIAHRLTTIMGADNILVLSEGSIAEQGSHNELLANKDSLYYGMWHAQMNAKCSD